MPNSSGYKPRPTSPVVTTPRTKLRSRSFLTVCIGSYLCRPYATYVNVGCKPRRLESVSPGI
jgi:hypothetical protein